MAEEGAGVDKRKADGGRLIAGPSASNVEVREAGRRCPVTKPAEAVAEHLLERGRDGEWLEGWKSGAFQ